LALSKIPLPEDALYEDLCFHAQQAAEKALKSVYRSKALEFRYTHDLTKLLDGLAKNGVAIPEAIREAADLTDFAWHARYPGPAEFVSEGEYQRALMLAERVVDWAAKLIEQI